jgi:3-oxoacyl-[acyl-carrier-protein] synthase II
MRSFKSEDARRVVITGLGSVSPVGNCVKQSWNSVLSGSSGIAKISKFDTSDFAVSIAGEVKNFLVGDFIAPKESRHMDTFIHFGIVAGEEALKDSEFIISERNREKVGVIVGSGIGGLPMIEDTHSVLANKGPRRVSPFFCSWINN